MRMKFNKTSSTEFACYNVTVDQRNILKSKFLEYGSIWCEGADVADWMDDIKFSHFYFERNQINACIHHATFDNSSLGGVSNNMLDYYETVDFQEFCNRIEVFIKENNIPKEDYGYVLMNKKIEFEKKYQAWQTPQSLVSRILDFVKS